jgi:hypothetical protein
MKSLSHVAVLTLVTVGQFATTSARAQAADTLTKTKSDGSIGAAAPDTTPHKHGMFGKLKSVAQNKTVQKVTKAAVCQALPGGQYMMGAAEAAKNKTSVAAGVAAAQSCIPGMGGAPGMGGVGGLGGGKGALAGAAMGAAGSIGGGGAGTPTGSARGLAGVPKLPGGVAMTSTAQGPAGMQTAMSQMKSATGGTGTGEMSTEAPGEQMKLSGVVPDEIKKGKLTIKKIDWIHSSAAVSPSTSQGFSDLIMSAATAMKSEGAKYRVDVYMDKKYSDVESAPLGQQRAVYVSALLQAAGQLGDAVAAGKVGKDKEQRLEIVKVK